MPDIGKAKREMTWAKDDIQTRRWDNLEERVAKVEQALDGLSEAEKAPLLAELAALRKQGEAGMKAEKAERIEEEIDRLIKGADPRWTRPEEVVSLLKQALGRLESEDAKRYLEPAAIAKLRARIGGTTEDAATGEKISRIARIEPRLKELEERLAADPFKGLDEMEARRLHQELNALIVAVRNHLQELPPSDANANAIVARLTAMETALLSASSAWQQDGAVKVLCQRWTSAKEKMAGWEGEKQTPTWEAFVEGNATGIADLFLSQTLVAIRECDCWLNQNKETEDAYHDDTAVKAVVAEAKQTSAAAVARVRQVFDRMLDDAERARTPTQRRELEKTQRLVNNIDRWFDKTAHLEASRARATALHDRWTAAVDKLDREGLALYDKLEAEAAADWPKILEAIRIEPGFDPRAVDKWKNKTILFRGVYNRAGWDFEGNKYNFAVRIGEIPVAGNYEQRILAAMDDVSRRTRQPVDDHKEWDVVGIVEGTGSIKQRVNRELRVEGTSDKIKTESWEPLDCVTIRIIALHAGPVAVGPR